MLAKATLMDYWGTDMKQLVYISILGVLNINIASAAENLAPYIAEAARLEDKIASPSLGKGAKEILRAHKVNVDNYIAARIIARDCSELLAQEPTLASGYYNLFPQGKLDRPHLVQCTISNGVAKSTLVGAINMGACASKACAGNENQLILSGNKSFTHQSGKAKGEAWLVEADAGRATVAEGANIATLKPNDYVAHFIFDANLRKSGDEVLNVEIYDVTAKRSLSSLKVKRTDIQNRKEMISSLRFSNWARKGNKIDFRMVSNGVADVRLTRVLILPDIEAEIRKKATVVMGQIESVGLSEGKFRISGWACLPGHDANLGVHLYLGGPAGTGTLVGNATAAAKSGPAILKACGTEKSGLVGHGFEILLPEEKWSALNNTKIFVHAIHPRGGKHDLIARSANFDIRKSLRELPLLGNLDGVIRENGKTFARGWACVPGLNQSVKVQLYVGGAAMESSPKLAAVGAANQSAEDAVRKACQSEAYAQFRFKTEIPSAYAAMNLVGVQVLHPFGGAAKAIGPRTREPSRTVENPN